jgi:glycerate kinase
MLPFLDQALVRLARTIKHDLNLDIQNLPGGGAAGGMGAGLTAFAGAQLKPGLDLVFDILNLESIFAQGARSGDHRRGRD